ncbi:MAG: hypothetical protein M3Z25_16470 [Actinomycetota bacterium]|nr:hypothetical protein [Actinomycetota bacterium]
MSEPWNDPLIAPNYRIADATAAVRNFELRAAFGGNLLRYAFAKLLRHGYVTDTEIYESLVDFIVGGVHSMSPEAVNLAYPIPLVRQIMPVTETGADQPSLKNAIQHVLNARDRRLPVPTFTPDTEAAQLFDDLNRFIDEIIAEADGRYSHADNLDGSVLLSPESLINTLKMSPSVAPEEVKSVAERLPQLVLPMGECHKSTAESAASIATTPLKTVVAARELEELIQPSLQRLASHTNWPTDIIGKLKLITRSIYYAVHDKFCPCFPFC